MRKQYTIFIFLLTLFSAVNLLVAKEGEVTITPSLNFSSTAVGSKSSPQTITIVNTSAIVDPDKPKTYRLRGLRFENNSADFNVLTTFIPNPEFSPGESENVLIEFAPKSAGNKNTRVWIHYYEVGKSPNDFDSVFVDVNAQAIPAPKAEFIIVNAPVIFQKALKPGEEAIQTFAIRNTGTASGSITAMEFVQQPNPDFTVEFTAPVTISAGQQQIFTVRFTAKAPADDKTNRLRITTTEGQLPLVDVRGRVENFPPPDAKLRFFKNGNEIEKFSFGAPLPPGGTRLEDFIIKNTGGQPIQIKDVRFFNEADPEPAFSTGLKPFPNPVIYPSETRDFTIRFSQDRPGIYTDTLLVITEKDTVRLALYGIVEAPQELQLIPASLDFKNVEKGKTRRDSIIIRNPNLVAAALENFQQPDAPFTIVSSLLIIQPKDSIHIVIDFAPADTLIRQSAVRFRAFGKSYEIHLKGKGFEIKEPGKLAKITIEPDTPVDFGEVEVLKDSVIIINLVNPNTKLLKAHDFTFKSNKDTFSLIKNFNNELDLGTGKTRLTLKFTPEDVTEYVDTLQFLIRSNDVDTTYSIALKGKGKAKEIPAESFKSILSIGNMSVAIGDTFSLPVLLKDNTPVIQQGASRNFSIDLRFPATVLYPIDTAGNSRIINGERVVQQTGIYTANTDSIITRVRFLAALGDMATAQVRIENFSWLDNNGLPLKTEWNRDTAEIAIEGAAGRLVNANQRALVLTVSPNPADADIFFEISNFEADATLKIYNTQGELVRDLSSQITFGSQILRISFPSAEIPEGMYFCRLTSGRNSVVRSIFVRGK